MKKIITFTILSLSLFSFSFGARLSLAPQEGNISENCIEQFKVVLDMNPNDEAITMDLILNSNMEFVNFENGSLFKYVTPAYTDGNLVSMMLFNDKGGEITQGGLVGTLYYKTTGVSDPYIEYYFLGKGETVDTNANINGRDILELVQGGKYTISTEKICDNPVVEVINLKDTSYETQMDEFVQDFENDHIGEKILENFIIYKWYIIGFVLLLIVAFLVSHKIQKKG